MIAWTVFVIACACSGPAFTIPRHRHKLNEKTPESKEFSDIPDEAFVLDHELSPSERDAAYDRSLDQQRPLHSVFPLVLVNSNERNRYKNHRNDDHSSNSGKHIVQGLNGGDQSSEFKRILDNFGGKPDEDIVFEEYGEEHQQPILGNHESSNVQVYYLGSRDDSAGLSQSEHSDVDPYRANEIGAVMSKFHPTGGRREMRVLLEEYPGMVHQVQLR